MIIWLSPRLSAFQYEHPNIGIKLVTSLWQNELEKHPVDVEILLAAQNQSDPRMGKLSDERIVPVCGLQTSKQIQSPADLTHLDAIHVLGFDDHWARYLSANDLPMDKMSPRIVVDTSVAACELAAAENGSAIMFERFAQQAIAAGRPIKIVGDPVANGQSHYVVQRNSTPTERSASTAFCEWLATCF